MGFYIRKSVSAGPFRFNLSRSGLGVSVGVKGFRVGSGPRGNYIHMGRGGLYYRASLGSPRRAGAMTGPAPPLEPHVSEPTLSPIEVGNVLEMVPSSSSEVVRQINEKAGRIRLWPWVLVSGLAAAVALASEPVGQPFALALSGCTAVLTALTAFLDIQRKTVVLLYDLDKDVISALQAFTGEFDRVASASRIWNIDAAGRTYDWKRNAGASRLIDRKRATFGYSVPKIVKTNLSLPCITGGRQNLYFFPDTILIKEGGVFGAISYEDFDVYWNTTVFIEDDSVPSDAQVVGYTWRFVNRDGGPDRRFNNNRQIPRVLYQQMGLQGSGGFQKILHVSKVDHRDKFNASLKNLSLIIRKLEHRITQVKDITTQSENSPLAPAGQQSSPPQGANTAKSRVLALPVMLAIVGAVFGIVLCSGIYVIQSAHVVSNPLPSNVVTFLPTPAPAPNNPLSEPATQRSPELAIGPSFNCGSAQQPLAKVICADPALSVVDLRYVQAYQALRQASADDRKWTLQQEAISFLANVEMHCGLPSQGAAPPVTEQLRSCISTAYDMQRSEWIGRLPIAALPEVSRGIDQHIELQRDLSELGFLPTNAPVDGVYGPATRIAITTWQKARGHVPTSFLSELEAKALSDEAITRRGNPLAGQPSTAPGSPTLRLKTGLAPGTIVPPPPSDR